MPAGAPLLPGDLVFYATAGRVHHVGLYIGGGNMIDAPDFGQAVKVEPYRHPGDDYVGATRPTTTRSAAAVISAHGSAALSSSASLASGR